MENEIIDNVLPENEANRGVEKKRKKGNCNLRESLIWNPAFLSDEGILDSDELSSLGGPMRHDNVALLSSNDTGAEKPKRSLPMTNQDVSLARKHGSEMNSKLSSAHKIDQGIGFQHRNRGQEIKFGYKALASSQAVQTTDLDTRHGGCPRPSGLNIQRKITKTTNSGVLSGFLDCKSSFLDKKNVTTKPYDTLLTDARVKDKSNSFEVNNLRDIRADINEIRPSTVLSQQPSRLRMPSPSLGFFSKGVPKFSNNRVQDAANIDEHSNFERVLSTPCLPHSKMKPSYHTFCSKLRGNSLLKLDGKLASEYSNINPDSSMPTKNSLLSKTLKLNTVNRTLTIDKWENMQSSTDLSQVFGTHAVEASSFFEVRSVPTANDDQCEDGCATRNYDQLHDPLYTKQAIIGKAEVADIPEVEVELEAEYLQTKTFLTTDSLFTQDQLHDPLYTKQAIIGKAEVADFPEEEVELEAEDLQTKTCLTTDILFTQDERSALTTSSFHSQEHETNFGQMAPKVESQHDHLQVLEEVPECGILLRSDCKIEVGNMDNINDSKDFMSCLKEKKEVQSEQVDNSDETNLVLLPDSTIPPCGSKFHSELYLYTAALDSGVEGDMEPGGYVYCMSRPETDSVVKIDISADSILNQKGTSLPIADALGHFHPHKNKKDPFNHTQCTLPNAPNPSDSEERQEKKDVLQKQDECQIKLNSVTFSDEWLAAIESVGEVFLARKTGAVQNSPPEKAIPEPSPWSPVKRNVRGPFDCTKH